MEVSFPMFQLGFKEEPDQGGEQGDVETEVLLELMASDASPLFRRLLDAGLVNESSFGCGRFSGSGYSCVLFSGESRDPKAVAEEVCREAERLRKEGIDPQDFSRAQKAVYGRNISLLNSAEAIANAMVSLTFRGQEIFRYLEAIAALTPEDLNRRLQTQMLRENAVLSVVSPRK